VAVSIVAVGCAPWALKYGFGPRYESALAPLVLLLAGTVVIGFNGILGTVLIALRRTWVVALQVGVSLAVNASVTLLLVPRFGANGAAIATLATELVGLCILGAMAYRVVPDLLRPRALPVGRARRRAAKVGELHQEPGL
jgi:O-antigen/teichoic acid export membrane protein